MAIGTYTQAFESAISPWTTLGPLAFVISISLLVEGNADYKRHKNDADTNNAPCVVLRRAEEMEAEEGAERDPTIIKGKDVVVNINKAYYMLSGPDKSEKETTAVNIKVGFQKMRRKDIRQGHFVLVKNREMVPADIVILASSNEAGSSYIETSSIDGETNLKLRTSPQLPKSVLHALRDGLSMGAISEDAVGEEEEGVTESIEAATKRLTRFSCLGRPDGTCVLENPDYKGAVPEMGEPEKKHRRASSLFETFTSGMKEGVEAVRRGSHADVSASMRTSADDGKYVAALVTEAPNPSVHTFSGKLTLPPFEPGADCHDIPLGADNVLLRGAVLRNTEWCIGLAFFTGRDTKLVQNSFDTPSKFSQLDKLMNWTVVAILFIMFCCISVLSTMAILTNNDEFDDFFYLGLNKNTTEPWPYFPPDANIDPPNWETSTPNWAQYFFLYVTLLNNFIPLSLYVTVEFITFCMLWFIYADLDMYDDTSDTRAVARSTIVTDLGQIQYIFSDKTGTLTQNVMGFKRCSVDGMVFGAPIQKTRPGVQVEEEDDTSSFHPLRQLLVGRFKMPQASPGLEGLGASSGAGDLNPDDKLTFNAEMFLRVMSLCHTVVVEKDIDQMETIDSGMSVTSTQSGTGFGARAGGMMTKVFGRRSSNGSSSIIKSPLSSVSEDGGFDINASLSSAPRDRTASAGSFAPGVSSTGDEQGPDGAPYGYAYQAESPDEGALVSGASKTFGFQVVGRDSSGIRLRTTAPSHLQDDLVVSGLKTKSLSLKHLAAETASELDDEPTGATADDFPDPLRKGIARQETWTVLAVNKFDSTRKRMSVLVRSPPELGSLVILFCKGADSAMLEEPGVASGGQSDEIKISELAGIPKPAGLHERERDSSVLSALSTVSEGNDGNSDDLDQAGWEMAQMLGIQAHLGDFAREGLRTLVLGMRVLTEDESTEWLAQYSSAAISIENRSELLTEAAVAIERDLHIVGATAIEDKLQRGVPETISQLEKAGIKLWVLTGDKRETAVEIGYSTHVLTPKMHLTEVADKGKHHVRTQMAMEFIRLVKMGKLPEYQKAMIDESLPKTCAIKYQDFMFSLGKCWRSTKRSISRAFAGLLTLFWCKKRAGARVDKVKEKELLEENILKPVVRRRNTRNRADKMIQLWLESEEGQGQKRSRRSGKAQEEEEEPDELSLLSEETPLVFNRAASAKALLSEVRRSGRLSHADIRKLSIAHLTAAQHGGGGGGDTEPLVDEDTLSLDSFFPGNKEDVKGDFDKRKRTLLERLFAIDREVRKGQLKKHMTKEKLSSIRESADADPRSDVSFASMSLDAPRALVIEGAALKHLLGDPELEEILFAVASNCGAVIACRVSPKQKAELVNLVRHNIKPEPITLAIGDGANDVGMIQEAHVGIGISGKEGKQAVNAADFAIAQFRFLEELVLIHGRWNFFRLSTVVLYSFYKNALMAGILIIFASRSVYSGTPLFDEWLIAILNFVCAFPIILTGTFDRCLSKEYVKKHPEVYKATRQNELITTRTLLRWIIMVFVHTFTLYMFTVPQQSFGGGITSAFDGLMRNEDGDSPGDGEGGDLKSVGTVTFTCLILLLGYKVLFETRSLVHGRWPAYTCRKNVGEGVLSRLAYTWIGVLIFSYAFYFVGISIYQLVGPVLGAGQFSAFTMVTNHVFSTRSMSWLLVIFVPITGMVFDVTGKVFSNMYYPTQTQVHLERESQGKVLAKRRRLQDAGARQRRQLDNPLQSASQFSV